MKRATWVLALVIALTFTLVGCGDSADSTSSDDTPGGQTDTVRIADERIIGTWESEDDGVVEFRDDGIIVLESGDEFPFAMPSADRIDIEFPDGPQTYNLTWEGDDRHGVLGSGETTLAPTWYDRK